MIEIKISEHIPEEWVLSTKTNRCISDETLQMASERLISGIRRDLEEIRDNRRISHPTGQVYR